MRKFLLVAITAIAVLIGGFALIVAFKSPEFRITRSATIVAPPTAVFAQINDFHKWEAWSPWAKLDPAAKNSFAGAAEGTGASFHWVGNDQIGEGGMTITESKLGELVRMRLDFLKPMAATNTADFTFVPSGNGTTVTWSMFGRNNFISRAVCLFMDIDKLVGSQFDQGLANIKTIVEAAPKP